MNSQEFTALVQSLESNLKSDCLSFDTKLEGYRKYYSEIEFMQMKKEYENIINASGTTNPTTYSYIYDILRNITIAYEGTPYSDKYPPFGIIETSRYTATKATTGSTQVIFIDFGLVWAIQLISDVLVSHLLYYKKNENRVEISLSRLCGITLHLIDHRIHEIGNDFVLNYTEMTLASYLQYAITTFVCAHEFIHYVCLHDESVTNEYYADLQGTILTMKVIKEKIGDDRVAILGIIILFLFLSVVQDLDKNQTQDILLEPKTRLKQVLDKVMPGWLLTAKNTKSNLVDKLFTCECITSSLNALYNEVDAIFMYMRDLIKGWRP